MITRRLFSHQCRRMPADRNWHVLIIICQHSAAADISCNNCSVGSFFKVTSKAASTSDIFTADGNISPLMLYTIVQYRVQYRRRIGPCSLDPPSSSKLLFCPYTETYKHETCRPCWAVRPSPQVQATGEYKQFSSFSSKIWYRLSSFLNTQRHCSVLSKAQYNRSISWFSLRNQGILSYWLNRSFVVRIYNMVDNL